MATGQEGRKQASMCCNKIGSGWWMGWCQEVVVVSFNHWVVGFYSFTRGQRRK